MASYHSQRATFLLPSFHPRRKTPPFSNASSESLVPAAAAGAPAIPRQAVLSSNGRRPARLSTSTTATPSKGFATFESSRKARAASQGNPSSTTLTHPVPPAGGSERGHRRAT